MSNVPKWPDTLCQIHFFSVSVHFDRKKKNIFGTLVMKGLKLVLNKKLDG